MTATSNPTSSAGTLFPDTQWSAVRKARESGGDESRQAIDRLCATYWRPINAYICYLGVPTQDADDLTQEFFHQLMVRRNLFLEARRERGKLRTYVCVAVKRLVRDSFRNGNRLKRGGGTKVLPLDRAPEPRTSADDSPDYHFDRQWATALIDRTLVDLEADYSARGKSALFGELRRFIVKDRTQIQEDAANRLGMNVGTFRMNLSRLRSQFGELFRQQVSATIPLGNRCDVDEEIGYLMGLFEASSNSWSP